MQGRPEASPLAALGTKPEGASGAFVQFEGETYYRISSFHRLAPFLMAIPGDADLWMFLSSGGGLTAGRVNSDGALFPYRTVDELHDAQHDTGPVSLLRVGSQLWQPFRSDLGDDEPIERNLYKSVEGNRVVFEEIQTQWGLRFRHAWSSSDEMGWVRTVSVQSLRSEDLDLELLDGLRNILPYGAPLALYQQAANLVDAYKRNEVVPDTSLAIYSLTAGITDRAEALEVLRANIAWSCGLPNASIHLDQRAIAAFRAGRELPDAVRLNGARGSYLQSARLRLQPGQTVRWHVVVDAMRDQVQISSILAGLRAQRVAVSTVDASLRAATQRLRANVASGDGLQLTGSEEACAHHFASVLFNNMRGGVFDRNYEIAKSDFEAFLSQRNARVAASSQPVLATLPPKLSLPELLATAREQKDPSFERLVYEYLPLYFGRRHGDPSRPWNQFSIRARGGDGQRELNYEGNWRDIFQNWEALGLAFPAFLPSMVAKFLNASTADGHNPYRLSRAGVDWEIARPDDPWSHIGYWGDHQIVYLTRLLEAMHRYLPDAFGDLLDRMIFSYANVPYRIRPYAALVLDPRHTIEFDFALQEEIERRIGSMGSDGRLLPDREGSIVHASLIEKLLVPALAKLSNLVPDAGIWMNTQRPEWNDANNALAGNGVSVVTLCHLRRYLQLLGTLLEPHAEHEFEMHAAIARWFESTGRSLEDEGAACSGPGLDEFTRRRIVDRLGENFSAYRAELAARGLGAATRLPVRRAVEFCRAACEIVDWGIRQNQRSDGLYHSYNLLSLDTTTRTASVSRLNLMLEGQVAVLSSALLAPDAALALLERLHASALYRSDQQSFLLYPEAELPSFLQTNVLPEAEVRAIAVLDEAIRSGDRSLVQRDAEGRLRFHADLRHAEDLERALDRIGERDPRVSLGGGDRAAILALFERVFRHRSYTGRSGVMYAFEGLGCIYWHLVAKLLVATQEQLLRTTADMAPRELRAALAATYHRIRDGLGFAKPVASYGAFPSDPYSHTPAQGGAQQPGMTGQVKEQIVTRLGELGVRVERGILGFDPELLRGEEFRREPSLFEHFDVAGRPRSLVLGPGSLVFTVCQVPVVYQRSSAAAWIEIHHADGRRTRRDGRALDASTSREIFLRSGQIESIHVHFQNTPAPNGDAA